MIQITFGLFGLFLNDVSNVCVKFYFVLYSRKYCTLFFVHMDKTIGNTTSLCEIKEYWSRTKKKYAVEKNESISRTGV